MSATFEQWVKAVFDHEPAKKGEEDWYWGPNFEVFWDFLELTDDLKVRYLSRLFRDPEPIKVYSLDQVATAIWFLIGESSPIPPEYLLDQSEAPLALRVEAIRSMADFFAKFVAPAAPGAARDNEDAFHGACYMWWDIFPVRGSIVTAGEPEMPKDVRTLPERLRKLASQLRECGLETDVDAGLDELEEIVLSLPPEIREDVSRFRRPEAEPVIHESCLQVMQEVLSLPSELCQLSALHGLNHWQAYDAPRVEQIIDAYLATSTTATPRMREWAVGARRGFRQ
jgi:hypothetical protein